MSKPNTPEYNKQYYLRRKQEDPEWYAKRVQQTKAGNKRRYRAKLDSLLNHHIAQLRTLFAEGNEEAAKQYLNEHFTMKVVKNNKKII